MSPKRSALTRQGLIKYRHQTLKHRLTSDYATEQSLIILKYQRSPDDQCEVEITESETKFISLHECRGCGCPCGGRGHPCQEHGVPRVPNSTMLLETSERGGHRPGAGRGGGDQRGAVGGVVGGRGGGDGNGGGRGRGVGGGDGRRGGGGGGRRGRPGRGGGRAGRGGRSGRHGGGRGDDNDDDNDLPEYQDR